MRLFAVSFWGGLLCCWCCANLFFQGPGPGRLRGRTQRNQLCPFIDGVKTVSETMSNCCKGGIRINDNSGVTCPGGIIGSVVDCKFVPDAVQPISSGSSNPYHGEFGTACLLSALGSFTARYAIAVASAGSWSAFDFNVTIIIFGWFRHLSHVEPYARTCGAYQFLRYTLPIRK